ncbi:DNA-processing protein DprA [Candidatus Sumerlaeota bacterium]|nr:DNA-processing protein DprA [Candidatus Sumerlaeota bacterium]
MTPSTADLALWTDWLTLAAIPQVGRRRLWQLITALGSPGEVLRASPRALRTAEGVDEVTVNSIVEHRDTLDLRPEAEAIAAMGARLIPFTDPGYPRALRAMDDPPPLLHVLGELEPLDEVGIAIVGSRNMTDYGRQMTEAIAGDLAEAGVTVISGFATGVDGAAHRAALERGGRTLAVLGAGLDIVYPSTHRRLRQRVAESGALISEYRLGAAPRAEHFPERNAVLAGLAQGVVVVEAGEKSGALITATRAAELGRPVFAVPGDATRANSRGVNRLIQEGARLVMSAEDVLADMRGLLRGLLSELGGEAALGAEGASPDPPPVPSAVLEALDEEERGLFTRIQGGAVQLDTLMRGLDPDQRAALPMHLMNLQLHGLIAELPGKRYTACPSSASLETRAAGPTPPLNSEDHG